MYYFEAHNEPVEYERLSFISEIPSEGDAKSSSTFTPLIKNHESRDYSKFFRTVFKNQK